MLQRILGFFKKDDGGQDLAEYCLIAALIALVALGIFYRVSGGMGDLWGAANTRLNSGNAAVSAAQQ